MFEEQIYLLILIILLPSLIIFLIWRGLARAAIMRRIGDQELVQTLTAHVSPLRRQIKAVLWLGAISTLLLALARPTWGVEQDIIRTEGIQIVFAIDISRSMDATDMSPTRLERAILDVRDMMTAFDGNDISIVLFAREAFTYMPLTYDLIAADVFLDGISTSMVSLQGTNIPAAIERSLGSFEIRSDAQRVIIVMTDGESHEGDAIAAAQIATEEATIIYTIGYGTETGSTIPIYNENGDLVSYQTTSGSDDGVLVNSTLNVDLLERIANEANGIYQVGGTSLDALISDIQQLESGDIGEQVITRPIERFSLFVVITLVLLSLEMILPETKREVI
ncbi:MAG: VWA domain-containing protein [Phototrophicaceae bacterium]